jgi:hypothetical protein
MKEREGKREETRNNETETYRKRRQRKEN